MKAALAPLTAKLTDRPETQQRAPQAAERAIPQETEEAKAARRAKAQAELEKTGWTPKAKIRLVGGDE